MKHPKNWVVFIKSNENAALEKIYRSYKKNFVKWLIKNGTINEDDALDIFQASVLILYDNVQTGKIQELENVRSYIYGIGKNKLLELYRKKRKQPTEKISDFLLNTYVEESSETEIQHQSLETLFKSINLLGDPCKTLLINFYYKNWSMDKIAVEMGYKNNNTVKSKKFKCIRRLRSLFQKNLVRYEK